ncbi:MAG: ribonuclease III [Clostridiales bacterium]|jgi:ribonuclease-3 family protein|nr:ribonuclease III [Clostridiales bacterium]
MTLNLNLSTDKKQSDPALLSPQSLAFIGDTIFDLLVREMLVRQANRPVGKLHSLAAQRVCADAQADGIHSLWENGCLTDEEVSVLKRGRNAHTSRTPKNTTQASYHLSTACEALFGYLYLKGDFERVLELFSLMCEQFEKEAERHEQD